MIANKIAFWRSQMNDGRGISKAHLARRMEVSRSFITKLEKGHSQLSAELMLKLARYFKRPVEDVFELAEASSSAAIPCRQFPEASSRPSSGDETVTDKSLPTATAKGVAPPVAQ